MSHTWLKLNLKSNRTMAAPSHPRRLCVAHSVCSRLIWRWWRIFSNYINVIFYHYCRWIDYGWWYFNTWGVGTCVSLILQQHICVYHWGIYWNVWVRNKTCTFCIYHLQIHSFYCPAIILMLSSTTAVDELNMACVVLAREAWEHVSH